MSVAGLAIFASNVVLLCLVYSVVVDRGWDSFWLASMTTCFLLLTEHRLSGCPCGQEAEEGAADATSAGTGAAVETTSSGTAAEHAIKAAADDAGTRMILGRRLSLRVGILGIVA